MNRKNIELLISALEISDTYVQSAYEHRDGCGTPACIAGHAAVLAGRSLNEPLLLDWVDEVAMDFLGIDSFSADNLFDGEPFEDYSPDREDAVFVLRHLLKTGDVRWDLVEKKV